ncbi:MAG TPA: nucleotidyl transferase AbiEii/AbiGii toxin family protein [Micromonosporaceae bacterium]|jgi:hypothetical protein
MELNRDFSEFIASCVVHDVRFMIVGGYAVAAHGHPRFTKDLDVWVWVDDQNANRLVAALDDFGFGSVGLTPDDFLEEGMVVQLGYPPKRIDIITQVDGVEFDPCWERHIEVDIGGQRVPFISVEDLLANKKASGRPRDLADAAAIEQLSDEDDDASTS